MVGINILVAGEDKRFRKKVRYLLGGAKFLSFGVVSECESGWDVQKTLTERSYDFVIIDESITNPGFVDVVKKISEEHPSVIVVVVLEKYEKKTMKLALTAGAREILEKPSLAATLADTIKRIYNREMIVREEIKLDGKELEDTAKIISVFSPKGGVGKTTISTNLAVALASEHGKKVLVMDVDFQFGDCAIVLNVGTNFTISEAIENIEDIENTNPEDYLERHPSGVFVLPVPNSPEMAEFIKPHHLQKLLDKYMNHFDYIIIDCPNNIDENVLTCFERCHKLLMLSTIDIATIRNVKTGLGLINTLGIHKDKIKIVLNQATQKLGVKYSDMEDVFGHFIWAYIPYDRKFVVKAVNRGDSLLYVSKRNVVTKSVLQVANNIAKDNYEGVCGKK